MGYIITMAFALLLLLMLLVKKHCKNKPLKIVLVIAIALMTLYCVIFSIDYRRVTSLRSPIFVYRIPINDDINSDYASSLQRTSYQGLGYRVEVERDRETSSIIKIEMYIFNKIVAATITNIENNNDNNDGNEAKQEQFRATILEVYPNGNLIVEPEEGESIRKSADKISITSNSDRTWEVGEKVIVTYTGEVMESYPAQIKTIDVQKIDNRDTRDLSNKYPEVIEELERLYGKEGNFKVIGIKGGEIDQRDYRAYEYFEGARTSDWQGRYFDDAFLLISSDYLAEPIYVANNFYSLKNMDDLNME